MEESKNKRQKEEEAKRQKLQSFEEQQELLQSSEVEDEGSQQKEVLHVEEVDSQQKFCDVLQYSVQIVAVMLAMQAFPFPPI